MNFQRTLIAFLLRRRKGSRRPPTPVPQVPMLDEEDGEWDFLQHERDGPYCDDPTSNEANKNRFEWLAKAANKLRGSSIDTGLKRSKGFKLARNTNPSEPCDSEPSPLSSLELESTVTQPKLLPRDCRRRSTGSHSAQDISWAINFKPYDTHRLENDLLSGPASSSSTVQQQVDLKNSDDLEDRQDPTPIQPGSISHHTHAHHAPQQSSKFELRKVQFFDINLRAGFNAPNYPMLRYNHRKHSSDLSNINLPSDLSTCWRNPGSESSGTIKSTMTSSMISTFSSLHTSSITDPSGDEEELQDCFDTEPNFQESLHQRIIS
ncbi:uncharacterized protein MELLADRAFT_116863 [Melampsora larici-populina 98AG31]|uniref:Uncharacterized protein n=1 Tax=Melampsora larici-populina (strain 98AG31 / pathotype 3-4-7) TaxID=747676 RepID=F4RQT9_MELLP|nr:uncharacterized protein MELLADRAFT_116863 [Melampsora larici-populina 98AG31]EGG05097.1 hypothetical protein MELLADRAFT_116863 [Melampsora larici-populina 98AG31]